MNDFSHTSQSVLIIEDHVLFREGLVSLINSTTDFHVVAQTGVVGEGVEMALRFRPDVILVDFSLHAGTGSDITQAIRDKHPESKIILLATRESKEILMEVIRLRGRGYLLKNVSSSSLLADLRVLARAEFAVPSNVRA